MLFSALAYQFCSPADSKFAKCSASEKESYLVTLLQDFDNSFWPNAVHRVAMIQEGTGFSRFAVLIFNLSEFLLIMARVFAILFIVQTRAVNWNCWNRSLGWRSVTYLLLCVVGPLFLLLAEKRAADFFKDYQQSYDMLTVDTILFHAIVSALQFVAVFWVYGTCNFLNDIHLRDHQISVSTILSDQKLSNTE